MADFGCGARGELRRADEMADGWAWDESLYRGSASFYVRGRPPYAPGLAGGLARVLGLDGRGRLLDVGCGPGVLALLLADRFAEVIGLDADAGMLREAARRADAMQIGNARWVRAQAEALPLELGRFDVVSFGQSFHWMDRPRVAAAVRGMLLPGGAFVHISDDKRPRPRPANLPFPPPPFAEIDSLVRAYLGPERRAGQGAYGQNPRNDEALVLRAAGFAGPAMLRVRAAPVLERSEDDLVAWVYSLSGSAPHLFGERLPAFEADVRRVLRAASPAGRFAERPADTIGAIWRLPNS
jgi:SAM-dependent methyltransferase